jgi:hypothetical protein
MDSLINKPVAKHRNNLRAYSTTTLPTTRSGSKLENHAQIPIVIYQPAIDEANKVYLDFLSCLESIGAEPSILARLQDMTKN